MPATFVRTDVTADGCICSEYQVLQAINQNLAIGFEALENDAGVGGVAYVDGSGTTAEGNVSQEIFAANAERSYLFLVNNSDTDMWIDFAVAAVTSQPSIKLFANGGFYEPLVPPNTTVNIISASAGKAFTAKQAGV